ncbi:MAG: Ig-like domain-containing protein, partial [Clostridia bacterium]|nr:Ig-like domain-containing protein [Clostridia bacterium]
PDNKNVSWSSSATNVAIVADGLVTAVSVGKSVITVTTADGNKTAKCEITVEAATVATVPVTGVTVTPSSVTLNEGAKQQLTCTVAPANATNQAVSWTSGNQSVATVDGNGLITAVAKGTTTITATSVANNNVKATCTVTVEKVSQAVVDAKISYTYAGHECGAFEWGDSSAASADVEYKLKGASSYTKLSGNDKQYLIRQKNPTTARVDLVGLQGGAVYEFKITTSTKEVLTATDVTVNSYDRSGYAHFGKSDGVGAYNNDGTPKSNAVIVYVNEENKNTVTATVNGKEHTGIVDILQNAGTSKPLIVRIVGTVGAATWNSLTENNGKALTPDKVVGANGKKLVDFYGIERSTYNSSTKKYEGGKSKDLPQATLIKDGFNTLNTSVYSELIGLNSKAKYDASKDEFDSCWNDCPISGVKNVTVEGIGEGAEIIQWGMTFKNSSSIEVRNI